MKAQMMKGPYVQVDETPIKYLDPGGGKTALGYLWVPHRPGQDETYYESRDHCQALGIPLTQNNTFCC